MTDSDTSIGLARLDEAATIARMSRDLIEAGLEWAWTAARVGSRIRSRDSNVVVARLAERIAGFGIMRYGDESAHLDLLGVAPDFRRGGLGGRLVDWLEGPARVGGIAAIFLEVRSDNYGARAFYESMGWREVERIPGYYQGRESALRMRRSLGLGAADRQ